MLALHYLHDLPFLHIPRIYWELWFVGAYYYVCMAHGTKVRARGVPRGYP